MTPAARARVVLAEIGGGTLIYSRIMIVVAHPDDEMIMLGGQMWRMRDAHLLHVTDGAPRDGEDAQRYGFSDIGAYAAARRRELTAALIAGEAAGVRTLELAMPDKEVHRDLVGLSRRIAGLLSAEAPLAVLTHAYEGGHPDHDATTFAVHAASRLVEAVRRPAIIEMPQRDSEQVGEGGCDELILELDPPALHRKRRMADCFTTQNWLIARLPLTPERFCVACNHDFRRPPHPGMLPYEAYGWGIDGSEWRRHAAAALAELGLD